MALTTLSVTSTTLDGSLSSQDLESRFDTAMALLLTNNIVSVHINADDKARRQGKQLDIQIGYDDAAGAATLTNPYQLVTFTGRTLDEALTAAAAYRAANPTYFFAAPWHEHINQFASANRPFIVFQFYSVDGVNGPANWQAGGIIAGVVPALFPSYTAWSNNTGALAAPTRVPHEDLQILSDGSTTRRDLSARFAQRAYPRDFGAIGDGVTDDTTAIQAAIDRISTLNGGIVELGIGTFRITTSLILRDGVTLLGHNSGGGRVWRIGSGWEMVDGTEIAIDFGSGGTAREDAAVYCNDHTRLVGISFYYPGQDMSAVVPTQFPPTLWVQPTAQSVLVDRCNFVNPYILAYAIQDHANFNMRDCTGFPISQGVYAGSSTDNDYFSRVHFHPLYAYRGTPTALNSLVGWVAQNGISWDLRRLSASVWESCFSYGYNHGVYSESMVANPGDFITNAGALRESVFIGCGFDSCFYGAELNQNVWGNRFIGCHFAPRDAYNAGRTGAAGIKFAPISGNVRRDIQVIGCRMWDGDDQCVVLTNAEGAVVKGNVFTRWGANVNSAAVELIACRHCQIADNFIHAEGVVNKKGVRIGFDSTLIGVKGNHFCDFNTADAVEVIATGVQANYTISDNFIDGGNGINDAEQAITRVIERNQVNGQVPLLYRNEVTLTATSAGTLTLTSISNYVQILTGVATHTVQLPAANTKGAGNSIRYKIKNLSTGNVTVQRAGADTIDAAASIVLAQYDAVELVSDGVSVWAIF